MEGTDRHQVDRVVRCGAVAVLLLAAAAPAASQSRGLARDTLHFYWGLDTVTLDYDRQFMQGATAIGAEIPLDRVWGFGPETPARLRTTSEIEIDGHSLLAGTYTLWARPTADGVTLFASRQPATRHALFDTAAVLARATLLVVDRADTLQRFRMTIDTAGVRHVNEIVTAYDSARSKAIHGYVYRVSTAAAARPDAILAVEWDRFRWEVELRFP